MKTARKISNKTFFFVVIAFLILLSNNMTAEDLRCIVDLKGKWKFSIGDDKKWAEPGFNDSGWDDLNVPSSWEEQGYDDYNGFAWYRKSFTFPSTGSEAALFLKTGRIDDADEIYLNGTLIGKMGSFPPNFETAFDRDRKYIIPKGLLNINGKNVIVVRVYDSYNEGGIINGTVGIYTDENYKYLDFSLEGKWKFHLGDNNQWGNPSFDDTEWASIDVPQDWENVGYINYDGYAWYRKKFKLPAGFSDGKLYLSLGKVDDYDYVYLNGKLIGCVFDLDKDAEYRRKGYEYNARRIYAIPENLLKANTVNVLSVRVFDKTLRGGIYEGPIGIMKEDNYKKYYRKNYSNQPFWEYVIEEFIID